MGIGVAGETPLFMLAPQQMESIHPSILSSSAYWDPRAASAVAEPLSKPSDLKGDICTLPTRDGKGAQADCFSKTPGYQGQRGQNEVMWLSPRETLSG